MTREEIPDPESPTGEPPVGKNSGAVSDRQSTVEGELTEPLEDSARNRLGLARVSFAGPLPPPEFLKKYQEIQPDFPERILRLTEKEAAHRHEITRKVVWIEGAEILVGQIFGLIVALSAFGVAGYLGYLGHPAAASVIGSGTIAGLVAVFVKGRKAADSAGKTSADME